MSGTGSKQIKKWLYSKISIVVLLVVVTALSIPVWRMYERYDRSRTVLAEKQDRQAVLTERQDRLTEQVDRLESERGLEAELRRQFNAAREGEKMVILVEDENSLSGINESQTDPESDSSLWTKIKKFFRRF